MEARDIIIRPLVTEMTTELMEEGKYVFVVAKEANKIEIAKAVEKKYKVHVEKVNNVVRPGQKYRDFKTNMFFRRSDLVKYVVTLKKGDKIDEFLNI